MRSFKTILPLLYMLTWSSMLYGQIVNIEDKRSFFSDSINWFESLDLGFNIVKNTKTIYQLSGAVQLEFAYKNKLILSLSKANFVKAGEENFVNQGFQHLRYNSKWNDWLVYELFGQVQYNERANIKLRALAGTGLRFRLLEKEKQRANFGMTYMYEYDEEAQGGAIHRNSRMSNYLSLSLKPSSIFQISSTTYYQPLFSDFGDYRLSSESTLMFNFNARLSFRTTYTITYDTRAPAGAPNTIYYLNNGLRYRFQ